MESSSRSGYQTGKSLRSGTEVSVLFYLFHFIFFWFSLMRVLDIVVRFVHPLTSQINSGIGV